MDITKFKKRVYHHAHIKNSLIGAAVLFLALLSFTVYYFLDIASQSWLRFLIVIVAIIWMAIVYNLYYVRFLWKLDENDTRISVLGEVIKVKFKHYLQHYYNKGYGAKSFGLIITIQNNHQIIKLMYPFKEDVVFGVSKEAWKRKRDLLEKMNKMGKIEVTYLKRSLIIVSKIDGIEHLNKKMMKPLP